MQPQNLPARSAAATVVFVLAVASLAGLLAVPGVVAEDILPPEQGEELGADLIPASAGADPVHVLASDLPSTIIVTVTNDGDAEGPSALAAIDKITFEDPAITQASAENWPCNKPETHFECDADDGAELGPGDDVDFTLELNWADLLNPIATDGDAVQINVLASGAVAGEVERLTHRLSFTVTAWSDFTIDQAAYADMGADGTVADGTVDAVILEFNREVDADSLPSTECFTVAIGSATGVNPANIDVAEVEADELALRLGDEFFPTGTGGFTETISVVYDENCAETQLTDIYSLPSQGFSGQAFDGAAPLIIDAFIFPNTPELKVIFSESVEASDGGALGTSAFDVNAFDGSLDGVLHISGEDTALLTFDEDFIEDDEGTSISAEAGEIFDAVGNEAITSKNVEVKQLVIDSAETVGDGSGFLSRVLLTFNVPVDSSTFNAAHWSMDGYDITGGSLTTGNRVAELTLTPHSDTQKDTSLEPTLVYTAGSLQDADQEVVLMDQTEVVADDGANVVFLRGETVDETADGILDEVRVYFSEDLDGGTTDETAWKVAGEDIESADLGEDESVLVLTLSVDSDLGTGDTPSVEYVPGGLEATDGSAVEDISIADANDAAGPVLLSVTGNPGDESVLLTFSEPVQRRVNGGAILEADLVYGDNGEGASGITGLTPGSLPTEMTMELNGPLVQADVDGTGVDTLSFGPNKVTDSNGVPAVVADVDFEDIMAPTVDELTTLDTEGDGFIDAIDIFFTEELDDADFDADDFTVGEVDDRYEIDDDHTDTGISGNTIRLVLVVDTNLPFDTGVTPDVGYTNNGNLVDLAGNPVADLDDPITPWDGAGPVVVSATTVDDGNTGDGVHFDNGNGKLNAYLVRFSEAVTFDLEKLGGWLVDDETALVTSVSDLDSDQILVSFDEGDDLNTEALPTISYDASQGSITDGAKAALGFNDQHLTEDDGTLIDGAAPVLVSVEGSEGDDEVTAYFSEPVHNGGGQPLADDDLIYINADDPTLDDRSTDIDAIVHVDPFDTVVLTLDWPLSADDRLNDMIRVNAGHVVANAGSVVAGHEASSNREVPFIDTEAPFVEEVLTSDSNGDGRIDRIIIKFNEELEDDGFDAADFTVGQGAYTIADHVDTGISGNTIKLVLEVAADAPYDTDATPEIAFSGDPAAFKDLAEKGWAGGELPANAVDAAPPIIVDVLVTEDSPFIDIRFSEPVYGDETATLSLLGAAAFEYVDADGATQSSSVDVIAHALDDDWMRLEADADIVAADIGPAKDKVKAVADAVFDKHGLQPDLTPKEMEKYLSPLVTGIVTVDGSGDGNLDAIWVDFDGEVDADEGLDQSAWAVEGHVITDIVKSTLEPRLVISIDPDPSLGTSVPDTAQTPAVSYTRPATGAAVDAEDAPLASFDGATDCSTNLALCTMDGAAPALVGVSGNPGSDKLTLVFSEALNHDLELTDIQPYSDGHSGGASQVNKVEPKNGNQVIIRLDAPLLIEDLQSGASVGVKAGSVTADGNTGVVDAEDNAGLARELPVVDDVAPKIESVSTIDGDGNGWIDSLLVTLSEPVSSAGDLSDGFQVDGEDATLESNHADNTQFILGFSEGTAAGGDTDRIPQLTYDAEAGTIKDQQDNALADYDSASNIDIDIVDGAGPAIMSAVTEGAGGGALASYLVTFSEEIEDGASEAGWSVGGASASSVEDSIDDADLAEDQLRVLFNGASLGTADTPELTYASGLGDVEDGGGNGMAAVAANQVVEEDGAAPVILHVKVQPGSDQATVMFSEGVHNGAGGRLTVDRFTYETGKAVDDVTHAPGDASAILLLSAAVDANDLGSDTVAVEGAYDSGPDPSRHPLMADATPVAIEDLTPPSPVSAITKDTIGDGVLDEVHVDFSEPVSGTSAPSDWLVGGVQADSVVIEGGAVKLGVASMGLATDEEPLISYDSDGVKDVAGNAVAAFDQAATDGAPPALARVETRDATHDGFLDQLVLTFSEEIDVSNLEDDDLTIPGYDINGLSVQGEVLTLDIAQDATDPVPDTGAVLSVSYDPTDGADGSNDFFEDKQGIAAEEITGEASDDGAAPFPYSILTADDGDGVLDQIMITFSEDVVTPAFEAADFSVAGFDVASISLTSDSVTLAIDGPGDSQAPRNTGLEPQITYTLPTDQADQQADADGNVVAGFTLAVVDGAAPLILGVQAIGTDAVRVIFSEGAFRDAGASLGLDETSFTYEDIGADSREIAFVDHTAGEAFADITLDSALADEDKTSGGDQDTIAFAAAFDAAGNAASTEAMNVIGAPFALAAKTLDLVTTGASAGMIDAIEVTFDSALQDSLDDAHWSVAGADVVSVSLTGDDIVQLVVSEDLNGGETPLVSYDGDSVGDGTHGSLPFDIEPADGVDPVIRSATSKDTDGDGVLDEVHVEVSEPLAGTSVPSDWVIGSTQADSVVIDGGLVKLGVASMQLATHEKPLISYDGSGIEDAGALKLAKTDDFPTADGAAPVLLSAASSGPDKKEVTLTFSEAVEGSGSDGDVVLADLTYVGGSDGATAVESIDSVNGNGIVVVLDEGFDPALDATDVIGPAASLKDGAAAPNPATGSLNIDVDADKPDQIDDLAVVTAGLTANTVKLEWSPVGDDGGSGTPDHYEVYRHSAAITAADLDSATEVPAQSLSFAPATLLSGGSGDAQTVVVSGLTKTTEYHFAVRAVDEAGNAGDLSDSVDATTLDDSTPPQGTLTVTSSTHTDGSPSNLEDATLSWNALTDGESGVAYYTAVNDDDDHVVTTADDLATQRSLAVTGLVDGTHYVHVAAISGGGTKQADAFELIIDTEAPDEIEDLEASDQTPVSITLAWTAPGDDGDDGTAANYQIYRSTSAFTANDLSDAILVSGVVSPAVAGTAQSFEVTGLTQDTEYRFALRARDDAGNAGALSDLVVVETDPDTTPPTGTLGLRSTSHTEAASFIRDVSFAWEAASDDEADVSYRYAFVQEDDYVLSDLDESTTETSVTLDDVEPGQWTFFVAAESAGGFGATESVSVVLLGVTEETLEAANKKVVTKVTRKGDTNVIEWTLPKALPGDVAGVQVLRSNSPYQVIATIASDGGAFEARSFSDDSEEALETSKYLVTMYFGESESLGKQPEGQSIEVSEALSNGGVLPAPESPSIFSHSALYVGLVGVLAMIGLAVFAVVRHQRRPMEGGSA